MLKAFFKTRERDETGKLFQVFVSNLVLQYGVVALKVLSAAFGYVVHFSGSSPFGLHLTYEETFPFQAVEHGVKGAMSEFYLEVRFYFLFDLVSP
jgi:hypothetical protein